MATPPPVEPQSEAQSSVIQQFQHLIGSDRVVVWHEVASELRSQVAEAIAPDLAPACVLYPQTQTELATAVAYAYDKGWTLMPCGHGTKLHWGGMAPGVDAVVSTARLTRLVDHAVGDLTVTAEAGMSFAELQQHLRTEQQQLGFDPAFGDRATLGGIVATASTGSWRQRYGGIRDMLIGVTVVRPDGQMAKAGGQVVKNVAGYDLMKLMTGAYGTLGIVTQVTFRVYPVPPASQTVMFTGTPAAIAALAERIFVSTLTPTQFDVLSPSLMQRLEWGQGMGLVVRFQSIAVSVEQQVQQVQAIAQGLTVGTPEASHDVAAGAASQVQANVIIADEETHLWRRLRETMETAPMAIPVTCKIGVEPRYGTEILNQLEALVPTEAIAQVHRGSGIGLVRLDGSGTVPQMLPRLRQQCQAWGGYLTVLEAPQSWKRQIDIWGFSAQSLPVMQRIKQQFDPMHRLNPGRFIGSA